MFALNITNPHQGDKLEKQVIFRLETHPDGVAIFYDDLVTGERVNDIEEQELLLAMLLLIERAYWNVAGNISRLALMNSMPVAEIADEIITFLADMTDGND